MLGGLGHTSLVGSKENLRGPTSGVAAGGLAGAHRIKEGARHLNLQLLLRESRLLHIESVFVAVVAERHVIRLVLHQQIRLGRRVWLMAGETTERRLHLALIGWVHHV